MQPLAIHMVFDALAWVVSLGCYLLLQRTWFSDAKISQPLRLGYVAFLIFGAGVGAWGFGTANMWAAGLAGPGRSIEGALAGAILTVELYKKATGITHRTGAIYALPIALGIAIGRIGCLLSGMEDFTYGVPTGAGWTRALGWDFGDGLPRHPVQLYESLAMAGFAAVYALMVGRGSAIWKRNGFYFLVGFYGLQRFVVEFLKPYPPVFAGLTLFQWLSLALIAYAATMLATGRNPRPAIA